MELVPLDDLRVVNSDTPQYASYAKRLLAFIIDIVLAYAVGIVAVIPFIGLEDLGLAFFKDKVVAELVYVVAAFSGMAFYFVYMESSARQATWGKYWLGLKVCDLYHRRIDVGQAILRHLARIGSFFTCYIGFLIIFFNRQRRTLPDYVASTLVLNR